MWQAGTNSKAGFALLEVLVALVILSLVGTAAALGLPGARHRTKLAQTEAWLETVLADLRGRARREGRTLTAEFDLMTGRYRVSDTGWRELPSGVAWSINETGQTGTSAPKVTFLPDGTASGAVVAFRVGAYSSSRRLGPMTGSISHAAP
jgi:prepilin-type N-terminal cleavage/methylation domain-containing protein